MNLGRWIGLGVELPNQTRGGSTITTTTPLIVIETRAPAEHIMNIAWFLANHPDWIEYTCDKKKQWLMNMATHWSHRYNQSGRYRLHDANLYLAGNPARLPGHRF